MGANFACSAGDDSTANPFGVHRWVDLGSPRLYLCSGLCAWVWLCISACAHSYSSSHIYRLAHDSTYITPHSSAFPFKANPFCFQSPKIHLAFCVNNIGDPRSQRNCCRSFPRFVLSMWRWNTAYFVIDCNVSAMTAAPSVWSELADGQLWLAGSIFSASNFWKGVIPQIEFEVLLCVQEEWNVEHCYFFPHWKLQIYRGKKKYFWFSQVIQSHLIQLVFFIKNKKGGG